MEPPSERHPFQAVHASLLNRGAVKPAQGVDIGKRCIGHPRSSSPGIDALRKDPIYAPTYASAIMANLRSAEAQRPVLDYLADSPAHPPRQITERMRYILVDWLVEVHLRFRLVPETLFLAVEILDRFLNRLSVAKRELQLAACTAMMISAKYEEVYPPPVDDYHQISARVYPSSQILDYELLMLNELKYCITIPTVRSFVLRLAEVSKLDTNDAFQRLPSLEKMTCFCAEATLLCYPVLQQSLSRVAAAAVYLARLYLKPSASKSELWTPLLAYYSGYAREAVLPTASILNDSVARMCDMKCKGLYRKYERSEMNGVSVIAISAAGPFVENPDSL